MGSWLIHDVTFYIGLLASVLGIVTVFRTWFIKHINRWLHQQISDVLRPMLTNDERTVANYAHDAADSANKAHVAADEAKLAAFEARDAALDARDAVYTILRHRRPGSDN